ncbi:Fe3+-hydroxamate ABC transporter permease FhuB [Mesorhizobium sp. L-8-10]|uniref:Fe(3+)-hydroxamate ABC transporter permease FhuB n=1 Tax=Mesorhizobium sp. L-8-10 TaxID=2744523 RepID=UPI00192961E8|nr:Fe(3+)-hydroxamate ABC transporter permease FhuB [Mesorhizobium sp. L-8-10]BCH28954.1 Fe3+-hydroxamate ABC transporter permease FhuB [Mesorhizobium sp. L-8-10]
MRTRAPALHRTGPSGWGLALLIALPTVAAAWLTLSGMAELLPTPLWWQALLATDNADPRQLLFRHAELPRLAIAILAGGALGLSGALLQQVLRNPLAEPTTVGTFAGASLALTVATLYAPWLLVHGREAVALAGGGLTTLAVLALAIGRGFSPVTIIIGGLVVSLTCSSASALLMAMNREYSEELFIWQTGSLVQNGDRVALGLVPWLAGGIVAAAALIRPLGLLDLSDEGAASLGTRPAMIRLAGLAVAVALAGAVVAAVGVISFVGLAAPALVRLAGARSLPARLVWAALFGAALLWFTDRLVRILPLPSEIPAGTASVLLGAPLLLLLLGRLRAGPVRGGTMPVPMRTGPRPPLILLAVILALAVAAALFFGRGAAGWHWVPPADLAEFLALRAPRVAVALSAGVMLGVAGTLMQRMTGNPMAAPEVMGVSAGASLGVLALFFLTTGIDRSGLLAAAVLGALATLAAITAVGHRHDFAPERLLLAGVALATTGSAVQAVALASGDPRLDFLLGWLSGSTWRSTGADALAAGATAVLVLALAPLTARWLEILPLGDAASRSLGLGLAFVRGALLLLTALPTAVATLVIGPLSFVGLVAPHLAAMLGFRRALPQLAAAAALGGLTLVAADWLGRTLIFPWQVPAGLLAAFVGGPYFMVLMLGKGRAA